MKFIFESGEVAAVLNSLVESPGELWGDGLQTHFFIGERRENHEQLGRRLWRISFVHGDFRNEAILPLFFGDMPIDPRRILHGEEKLRRDALDLGTTSLNNSLDFWNVERPDQLGMPIDKGSDHFGRHRLTDLVRDVDGEKIRIRQKTIDRFQANVIGIDVPAVLPSERLDRGLRRGAHTRRIGTNQGVLPIRFVPDGDDVRAVGSDELTGTQLRFGLMGETIAYANGVFLEDEHDCGR